MQMQDPVKQYPAPPFPEQEQEVPGLESDLQPKADHGEKSYKGSGKLTGRKAIITGGDSGIGRAVAIAFAREGADVLISYLNEDEDAQETAKYVEEAGKKAGVSARRHKRRATLQTDCRSGGARIWAGGYFSE
jgi:hypothetical protein